MKKTTILVVASGLLASTLNANETGIVVYSATKSNQSIQDVTSNVEVITSSELESKHITNLTDAINLASGISFSRDGGLGQPTKINIRGMHQTNTLVLIDGVRFNDITNSDGVSFEFLDMYDVARIEVIKGAQSGIWGASASGGVINIVTKKSASIQEKISLLYEKGSFNSEKTGFNLLTSSENGYIKAGFTKVKTDGFSAQTFDNRDLEDLEKDDFSNTTSYVGAKVNLSSSDSIELNTRKIDAKGEYDAYQLPDDETRVYDSKINILSFNYEHTKAKYDLNIYTQKSDFDRNYPNDFTTKYKGSTNTFGFKSKIDYRTNDFLIVGSETNTHEDEGLEKEYTNKAYFLTNINRFKNTIFTTSLRKDNNDKFGEHTTGKIGLKQLYKEMYVSMNYGTAFKAPSLNQLYTPFYGNGELEAEETKAYDINFGYKGLTLSYFENKIDNLISFHATTYQNINIEGESVIKGYEVNYKKPLHTFLLSLNYTSIDAKDKDDNLIGRIPEENLKVSIDYFGIKKFNFNLSANYVGERYDRNYSTFNSPTPNGEQTGKYTVINSVIDYRYNKNTNLYLKIDNIGDKKYQVVDGYSTSPRAYYVGINAKF
jgi:vitamin B12 transporter